MLGVQEIRLYAEKNVGGNRKRFLAAGFTAKSLFEGAL